MAATPEHGGPHCWLEYSTPQLLIHSPSAHWLRPQDHKTLYYDVDLFLFYVM